MNTITVTVSPTAVNDLLNVKQGLMYVAKEYSRKTKTRPALDEVTRAMQSTVYAIMDLENGGSHEVVAKWHACMVETITDALNTNTNRVLTEMLMAAYLLVSQAVIVTDTMTEAAK